MAIKTKSGSQNSTYDLIVVAFVAVLLISNISATKLIDIGPFIADGGAVLFPLAYIFGDILTEVYGFARARRAIWAGFGAQIIAALVFWLVTLLPPSAAYANQAAFEAVLGFLPRIVTASLLAYLIGEFINSFVLARLKIKTNGRGLGGRFIFSTFIAQLFDTAIFGLVAFGGILSGGEFMEFVLFGWLFKTVVEIIMLPVTYRVVTWLKQREGLDTYDRKTDFNPFHLAADK